MVRRCTRVTCGQRAWMRPARRSRKGAGDGHRRRTGATGGSGGEPPGGRGGAAACHGTRTPARSGGGGPGDRRPVACRRLPAHQPGWGGPLEAAVSRGIASGALNYRVFEPDSETAVRLYGEAALIRYRSRLHMSRDGAEGALRQYWHTAAHGALRPPGTSTATEAVPPSGAVEPRFGGGSFPAPLIPQRHVTCLDGPTGEPQRNDRLSTDLYHGYARLDRGHRPGERSDHPRRARLVT